MWGGNPPGDGQMDEGGGEPDVSLPSQRPLWYAPLLLVIISVRPWCFTAESLPQ